MVLEEVEEFVREYFDQNPISQLSLVLMRDAVAPVLTQLAGNPSSHIATLKESYRWVSMRVWSGGKRGVGSSQNVYSTIPLLPSRSPLTVHLPRQATAARAVGAFVKPRRGRCHDDWPKRTAQRTDCRQPGGSAAHRLRTDRLRRFAERYREQAEPAVRQRREV